MVKVNAKLLWIIPTSSNKTEILSELRVQHVPGINQSPRRKICMEHKTFLYKQREEMFKQMTIIMLTMGQGLTFYQAIHLGCWYSTQRKECSLQQATQHSQCHYTSTSLGSRKQNKTSMAVLATAVIKDVLQLITKPLSHLFLITFINYFLHVTRSF